MANETNWSDSDGSGDRSPLPGWIARQEEMAESLRRIKHQRTSLDESERKLRETMAMNGARIEARVEVELAALERPSLFLIPGAIGVEVVPVTEPKPSQVAAAGM